MVLLRFVIAALVPLSFAGCGGDERLSKQEYEQKVREEYANVQTAFRATNVPLAQLEERVEDAQAALRGAADELDGVEPPEDVVAEHDALVEGMRLFADDLERVRRAAARGDQRTIDDFNSRIARNRSIEQMAEAAEKMRFKGYNLGPLGEE